MPESTFLPIWCSLAWSFVQIGWHSTLWIFLQNAVRVEFSHLMKDLGHCVNSNNIPKILPTTVHRVRTEVKTDEGPSLTLLIALSAILFVSGRWGADEQWFHGRSSPAFPNVIESLVYISFVFSPRSNNFPDFSPFLVMVLFCMGIFDIHWVQQFAYLCLFRNSPSSLTTLWSAVMISPNFVANRMWLWEFRLQAALVTFVCLRISQFGSPGQCVNKLCFPFDPLAGRGCGLGGSVGSLMLLPEDVDLVCTILSVNSSNHSGKSCNRFLDARVVSCSSRVFFLCFQLDLLLNSQGVLHLERR